MRVAVALPSLPRRSPLRAVLLETVSSLPSLGVEFEAFTEEPGEYDSGQFRTFHYLRLVERHRARAFDTGLYPLGRDWRPYESSLLSMSRLPGVVWVLDPVPHHLAVGGLAMRGWWDEYRDLLEEVHGEQLGATLAMTVAAGWAVRSTYRRFDPIPTVLARQRRVCAATPDIAVALRQGDDEVPVVQVPRPAVRLPASPRERCRRVLVLAFHYGWPEPVLKSLSRLLDGQPALEFEVVVPELLQLVAIGPRARELGIENRITWLPPDEGVLEKHVRKADLLVHLRDDPTAGEQALIDLGLSLGVPSMSLRAPGVRALPNEVAPQVEPGRGLGASFEGQILAISGDAELYRGLSGAAARSAAARPDAETAARTLATVLEAAGGSQMAHPPISDLAWVRLRERMRSALTPCGSGARERRMAESIADGILPRRAYLLDGAR